MSDKRKLSRITLEGITCLVEDPSNLIKIGSGSIEEIWRKGHLIIKTSEENTKVLEAMSKLSGDIINLGSEGSLLRIDKYLKERGMYVTDIYFWRKNWSSNLVLEGVFYQEKEKI